jgi:FkbM family methyltransferase
MTSLRAWVKGRLLSLLEKRGYQLQRIEGPTDQFFETLMETQLLHAPDFFFIQIGANDGVSFDPVHPFVLRFPDHMRGIVIEPLRDKFEELCHNYERYPQIVKVNTAIHNTDRRMTLYRVAPATEKHLPGWTRGIASFNPHHHELSGTRSEHMIAEEVECMSLSEIVESYGVTRLDLLVTDTEGYDYEILSGLDFARIRPSIIYFEHGLPCGIMSPTQLQTLSGRLHRNGYSVHIQHSDAVAFLPEILGQ